jgi:hypothetical protein
MIAAAVPAASTTKITNARMSFMILSLAQGARRVIACNLRWTERGLVKISAVLMLGMSECDADHNVRRHQILSRLAPARPLVRFAPCLSSAAGAVGGVANLITLEGDGRASSEQREAENQQSEQSHFFLLNFSSRSSCSWHMPVRPIERLQPRCRRQERRPRLQAQ